MVWVQFQRAIFLSKSRLALPVSRPRRNGRATPWSGRPQEEHRRRAGELPEVHGAGQGAEAAGETRDRGAGPACGGGWLGQPVRRATAGSRPAWRWVRRQWGLLAVARTLVGDIVLL